MNNLEAQNQSMAEPVANPEVLAEMNVESRIVLAFNVGEETVEKLLPKGWKATPPATGPSTGANLNVILADRSLVKQISETPADPPGSEQSANQLAVLAIPGHNPETGAKGVVIVFGLSADSNAAPGPYGVFLPAKASMERVVRSETSQSGVLGERWSFKSDAGDEISLELEYKRGFPGRSTNVETKAYSAKKPDFYRTYRADQWVNVLKSESQNINEISGMKFTLELPTLSVRIDDSESAISVISQPWTARDVFVQTSNKKI